MGEHVKKLTTALLPLDLQRDLPRLHAGGWTSRALGIDAKGVVAYRGGIIIGAIILDKWSRSSAQGHWWLGSNMALRANLHRETFRWFFEETGRTLLLGFVPGDKPKSLRLAKHCGFSEAYRIKDGEADGVDTIIVELRKDTWQQLYCGENYVRRRT